MAIGQFSPSPPARSESGSYALGVGPVRSMSRVRRESLPGTQVDLAKEIPRSNT